MRRLSCYGRLSRWTRVRQWLPRQHASFTLVTVASEYDVGYYPRRGYTCARCRRPGVEGAPEVIEFDTEYIWMKKVKIASGPNATGPTHLAALESGVMGKMHAIVKHCAVTRYDDGEPRRPGWVTIKTQGAMWMVTAKDPDAAAQISATGQTLDDALALLDLLLGAPDAPWEPDPFLKPSRTGRRAA